MDVIFYYENIEIYENEDYGGCINQGELNDEYV